jgi:hypothetical protein
VVQPGEIIAGMRVEVVLDPGPPGPLLRARALGSGRLHLLRLGPPGAAPPAAWVGKELPGLVPLLAIDAHAGAPVLVCAWRPGSARALRPSVGGPGAGLGANGAEGLDLTEDRAAEDAEEEAIDAALRAARAGLASAGLDPGGAAGAALAAGALAVVEAGAPPRALLLPPFLSGGVGEDDAPEAAPDAPALGAPAPFAGALALVVDDTGQGHAIRLRFDLRPGAGRVWAPEGVARDAQLAAQVAVAAALGPEARRWDLRWAVDDARVQLRGSSVGLAVAAGVLAARRGRPLPAGWALTGGVELDGTVSPVAGLPAKLRAAAAAGLRAVALPAAERPGLQPPPGLRLAPIADLDALSAALWPAPAWRARAPLALLFLAPLLAWVQAFAPLDAWLSHGLLMAARGPLPLDDVAVLAVDVPDPKALRAEHPATLRALAAAGARAVVFDLALSTSSPHDEEIAAAVAELREDGVPVIFPARVMESGLHLPPAPLRAAGAAVGLVEAHRDTLLGVVWAAPARRFGPDGAPIWHAAAWAAAAAQRPADPPTPTLLGDTLVVGALQVPTWAGLVRWPPLGGALVLPYGDVAAYPRLAGRVVLIGAWGGAEDLHRTPAGPRYGVELLAGHVETLLRQAALRTAPPEVDALAALGVGLLSRALRRALPAGRRGWALLVPIGALLLAAALAIGGVVAALSPLALAGVVGLWLGRRASA